MLSAERLILIGVLTLLAGGAGVCRAEADNRDGEDPAAKVKRYREQRVTLLQQIKALEDKGANRTLAENAALAECQTQVRQVETALAGLVGTGPKLGESKGTAPAGIKENPGGLATGGTGTGPGGMDTGTGSTLGVNKGAAPEGIKKNPGGLAMGAEDVDEEEPVPVSAEGDGTQDTAGGRSLKRPGSGPKLGEVKAAAPEGIRTNPGDLATTEEGIVPPRVPRPSEPPPKAGLSASIAGRLMEGLSFGARDRKLDQATAREVLTALGAQVAKLQNSIGFKQGGEGPAAGAAGPLGLGKLAQGLLSQPLQKREDFATMAEGLERLLGSLQAQLKGGAQAQSGVAKGAANRSELGTDKDGADSGRGGLQGAIARELRGLGPSIDQQVTTLGSYNDNWTPEQKQAYMGQLNALQNKVQMLSNLNQAIQELTKGTIQNIR